MSAIQQRERRSRVGRHGTFRELVEIKVEADHERLSGRTGTSIAGGLLRRPRSSCNAST